MENTAGKIGRYQDIKYYIETKDYEYRTELLNGEIVGLASPSLEHQDIAIEMVGLFRQFIKKNDGKCRSYCAPTDVRLNFENIVVPDVFMISLPLSPLKYGMENCLSPLQNYIDRIHKRKEFPL